MLVECPNCHRRYEPKPNEKYCPCCGEEIKEPLKTIEEPKPAVKEISVASQATGGNALRRNTGRLLSLFAVIIAFISLIFMFGPVYSSGYTSLFNMTFIAKQGQSGTSNQTAYVGLIIAFIAYAIMFIICIYEAYKIARNEANNGRLAIGVFEVGLIVFYLIYLTVKSTTNPYYGGGSQTIALGDGTIKFLVTLGISSILNFVAPFID